MCVVIFSTTFVWNISDSKKNWRRYDKKCVLVFMYSTRYSCQILTKLEFSGRFSRNTQLSNFMKICSVGSNKLINKMQQFHKFITWRLCVAQNVLGASSPIIRSLQMH